MSDKYAAVVSWITWPVAGALIGWMAWGQGRGVEPLLLLLGLPTAFGLAGSRWSAWALMAAYYMAGARGLPGGSAVFFAESAPWWYGWALWASACVLLSLPFALLWSPNRLHRGWRFVLATALVVVPPIGLIGWCSPLAIGGTLFPGLGWVGLLLTAGMLGVLATGWCAPARISMQAALIGILVVAGEANRTWEAPAAPAGWNGMNTGFSRLASGADGDAGQLLATIERVRWLKALAATVPANQTLLLPETLLGRFGGMAEFELSTAETTLAARNSRILVGAEIPQADGRYVNGLVVLGAGAGGREGGAGRSMLKQGIPVPVSMWMPWAARGAVADLWARDAVLDVGSVKAAALICYEQLLPWSMFLRAAGRPHIFLVASNVWWARGTSIPSIQRQTVLAFARLFGIAVVEAVNS